MKKFVLLIMLFFILIPSFCYAISVDCPNVILIDASNGRVIYEKEAYEHVAPASTTKVLTALLVLENTKLEDKVYCSYEAVMSVPSDGSNTAIQVGETLTVEQLLNCMLVASGNEAANVLAEHVGGTMDKFAKLMNSRAIELGCTNSNFKNPSGLSEEGHYSCAYDLAKIYSYTFEKFPEFREIICKTTYTLAPSEKHSKDDRKFVTTNKLLLSSDQTYYYWYCTGGKTGYTTEAKNCLVSSATKDGKRLICVVLGGSQDEKNKSQRFQDTINLFNYGFENLQILTLVNAGTVVDFVEVKNAAEEDKDLPLKVLSSVAISTYSGDTAEKHEPSISISGDVIAPVNSGDLIGSVTYSAYGQQYTLDLFAAKDAQIKPPGLISNIAINIFRIVVIGLILVFFIRFYNIIIRKKSNKERVSRVRRYNARFHR